jgi:hypothetical protein
VGGDRPVGGGPTAPAFPAAQQHRGECQNLGSQSVASENIASTKVVALLLALAMAIAMAGASYTYVTSHAANGRGSAPKASIAARVSQVDLPTIGRIATDS